MAILNNYRKIEIVIISYYEKLILKIFNRLKVILWDTHGKTPRICACTFQTDEFFNCYYFIIRIVYVFMWFSRNAYSRIPCTPNLLIKIPLTRIWLTERYKLSVSFVSINENVKISQAIQITLSKFSVAHIDGTGIRYLSGKFVSFWLIRTLKFSNVFFKFLFLRLL